MQLTSSLWARVARSRYHYLHRPQEGEFAVVLSFFSNRPVRSGIMFEKRSVF